MFEVTKLSFGCGGDDFLVSHAYRLLTTVPPTQHNAAMQEQGHSSLWLPPLESSRQEATVRHFYFILGKSLPALSYKMSPSTCVGWFNTYCRIVEHKKLRTGWTLKGRMRLAASIRNGPAVTHRLALHTHSKQEVSPLTSG